MPSADGGRLAAPTTSDVATRGLPSDTCVGTAATVATSVVRPAAARSEFSACTSVVDSVTGAAVVVVGGGGDGENGGGICACCGCGCVCEVCGGGDGGGCGADESGDIYDWISADIAAATPGTDSAIAVVARRPIRGIECR